MTCFKGEDFRDDEVTRTREGDWCMPRWKREEEVFGEASREIKLQTSEILNESFGVDRYITCKMEELHDRL